MFEWNYKSKIAKSTGYEDVMDSISNITPDDFNQMTDDEKNEVVDRIFNIIRSKNIFPIYYFNNEGIKQEISKCIEKNIEFDGRTLSTKDISGQHLCSFLFPNLHKVECKGVKNNSMWDRFFDDIKLKKTIKFTLTYEPIKNSYTSLYRSSRLIGGNVATNFPPMKAKALYEKYCPEEGVIYDFACGFGGRMLGALSSKNNYKYFGVEPCTETYKHLNELGTHIERNTGRKNSYKIICSGSEDYCPVENFVDFAFSSPPYFNLERYSEEDTQCYNKFETLESWFTGYVEPTITNIHKMLKPGAYYAVNIADFNFGNNRVEYVDKWIELSIKCGFEYVERISMKVSTRRGFGHRDENNKTKEKQEGIFVFKKI